MLVLYISIVMSSLLAFIMIPHHTQMSFDNDDAAVVQAVHQMSVGHQAMLSHLYEHPAQITPGWRNDVRSSDEGFLSGRLGQIRHRIMIVDGDAWVATYVQPGPALPLERFSVNLELDDNALQLGAGVKRGPSLWDPRVGGEIDIRQLPISTEIPDNSPLILTRLDQ